LPEIDVRYGNQFVAQGAAVEVPDGDPAGLADGILRIIRELAAYRATAARVAEDLDRMHSIDYVSDRLGSLFEGNE